MKLSMAEADKLVYAAMIDAQMGHLRFGQALWNMLPEEVAGAHWKTENDFFYWIDRSKVLTTFYKHFVEV